MTDTTVGNARSRPNKTAYSHDSNQVRHHADDYPTPAGFVYVLTDHMDLDRATTVWDPCAGGGHLVLALRRDFDTVLYNDLHYSGDDFLTAPQHHPDWIITNPPYKHAEAFVRQALACASEGVAMLVNTAFLEGIGRSKGLFAEHPPAEVLVCNRRMRLPGKQSSTFSHAWVIWRLADSPGTTSFGWLDLTPFDGPAITMPEGQADGVWERELTFPRAEM